MDVAHAALRQSLIGMASSRQQLAPRSRVAPLDYDPRPGARVPPRRRASWPCCGGSGDSAGHDVGQWRCRKLAAWSQAPTESEGM